MANQYLVDIHQHISRTLDLAEAELVKAKRRGAADEIGRCEGRLLELGTLRAFLDRHYNLDTYQYH